MAASKGRLVEKADGGLLRGGSCRPRERDEREERARGSHPRIVEGAATSPQRARCWYLLAARELPRPDVPGRPRMSADETANPTLPLAPERDSSPELEERIGPYRIVRALGEGGMGAVYLAEQDEPVRREVALKVIKLGMDSRQVLARFEAERQSLALMDHPASRGCWTPGRPGGRPYFVMEHVSGPRSPRTATSGGSTSRARLDALHARSARRCSTRTRRASSTATSSRRTCWWPKADGRAAAEGHRLRRSPRPPGRASPSRRS